MILAAMPVDATGKVVYTKFVEIMYRVKHTTIKNAIAEAQASDTEKLLLELCRDQEAAKLETAPGDSPQYRGQLTAKQVQHVLSSTKVGLSRLQITSVMAFADMMENMVDYWRFVPIAAKTIEKMLDPSYLSAKIEILSKGLLSQHPALGGKTEDELAQELNALFDLYDEDDSGQLDASEFHLCLDSLDLGLKKGEIDALMLSADQDESSLVDRGEFMKFTFNHLLHLMQEKQLALAHEDYARRRAADAGTPEELERESIEAQRDSIEQYAERAAHGDAPTDADAPGDARAAPAGEDPDGLPLVSAPGSPGFGALADPAWDPGAAAEQRELTAMFQRADVSGDGHLDANEFHRLLEATDLGLTKYQMARLMAEADEDEDGCISYTEFVPVMLRFLQIYRTKKAAAQGWASRLARADVAADEAQRVMRAELQSAVRVVEAAFGEAAKLEGHNGVGLGGAPEAGATLSRGAFLKCLGELLSADDQHDRGRDARRRCRPHGYGGA